MYKAVLPESQKFSHCDLADFVNPELMLESLKNNHVQACDGERITLHCPRNTQIALKNVFYGRLMPSSELCPSLGNLNFKHENTSCIVSVAHMNVFEHCRNKRKCKIAVQPSSFGYDPCASTSKYLQISYKCKATSFDDQKFCENSTVELVCKPKKRLTFYSAWYGRLANSHRTQCMPSTLVESVNDEIFSDAVFQNNIDGTDRAAEAVETAMYHEPKVKDLHNSSPYIVKDQPNIKKENVQRFLSTGDRVVPALPNQHEIVRSTKESTDSSMKANDAEEFEEIEITMDVIDIISDLFVLTKYCKNNMHKVLICVMLGMLSAIVMMSIVFLYFRFSKRWKLCQICYKSGPNECNSPIQPKKTNQLFMERNRISSMDMSDLQFSDQSFMQFAQSAPPLLQRKSYKS